jgi:lipid II:glycine glycyltransferase (peptidoglycan interpeptide bridge formation enzyme)
MTASEFTAVVTHGVDDPAWDDFLASTPSGSFAQSGMWARVKEAEGWRPARLQFTRGDRLVGGVQMLWKQKCGIRIGYVNKGPVLSEETPALAAESISQLRRLAAGNRIAILIVQPPDTGSQIPALLSPPLFLPNHLLTVISANLVVDLRPGWDALDKRMRRTTRREALRALRLGVRIREGGVSDLPAFHELMKTTCRRLNTAPNPRTVASFLAMWRAFEPRRCIRLTLAEHDGRLVAGLLAVMFGRAVTFWKKGSDDAARSCHADQALICEGMEWACRNEFLTWDFASMAPSTARALLDGQPLPEDAKRTRDLLHLGFGGEPVLLPESRVYIPNALLRTGYRLLIGVRLGRSLLRRTGRAV